MDNKAAPGQRFTLNDITSLYADGQRLAMATAYDYPTAKLLDEAGIPLLLVGDSVGRVMLGYDSEIRVTMTEMLHHTRAVTRGAQRALVIADMPFLSYANPTDALTNAGRFLSEAGAQAVKVEGGVRTARVIEALLSAGIPVMGHIGLTPQSINTLGRVRIQGKTKNLARSLLADAFAIQEAGAFAVVLELLPAQLAAVITARLRIPTIGIGSGPDCSGQVQVITDLLGLDTWRPKHARAYADLRSVIIAAAQAYVEDVVSGRFPGEAETVRMDDTVLEEVLGHSRFDRAQVVAGGIPLDRDL